MTTLGDRAIRAVVVDIDDTLVLTQAACFELENDVLQRIGRPAMSREVHRSTWGRPLLEAMRERSPGLDIDLFAAAHREALREYIESGRLDVVPEENLAALDELAGIGLRVMLLTSRTGLEVDHFSAPGHALEGRITSIFHGGNMRFAKPNPRAFDEMLADSDLAPAQCVYVGDSPSDAEAANGAGLHFIATLQGGLRQRADFAAYRVDAFVERFPDVVAVVKRLAAAAGPRAIGGGRDGCSA